MLSDINKPFMLSVSMPNVMVLSTIKPNDTSKYQGAPKECTAAPEHSA
jgi:hypothetical protein